MALEAPSAFVASVIVPSPAKPVSSVPSDLKRATVKRSSSWVTTPFSAGVSSTVAAAAIEPSAAMAMSSMRAAVTAGRASTR